MPCQVLAATDADADEERTAGEAVQKVQNSIFLWRDALLSKHEILRIFSKNIEGKDFKKGLEPTGPFP